MKNETWDNLKSVYCMMLNGSESEAYKIQMLMDIGEVQHDCALKFLLKHEGWEKVK